MLKYGPEVGVPRILDGYRRFGLKQTFFIPAWCIEQYPATVEAIVKDGHEVGFHGYIHEPPNALSREEEHYWMRRSLEIMERHTGKRPRGNRSPPYNFSIHTAELLAEEGFVYDASLMGDDVPYVLSTAKGDIVELPSSWALDDWPPYVHSIDLNYMFQIVSPDRAMETFMAEFEAMRAVGGGMETLFHDRLEEHAHRLAQHFQLAGDHERAVKYFTMAGEAAEAMHAIEESAAHFSQAVAAAKALGRDGLVEQLETRAGRATS
jgi:peptidoglycan/xylan/chitin deacetylase (PgdA/CDA1 family)